MRPSYRIVLLMLLCVVVGAVLANVVTTPTAIAQVEATAGSGPRYQISAYSSTQGNNLMHGAYIIDATTGKTWHVRQAGSQQVVLQKLP